MQLLLWTSAMGSISFLIQILLDEHDRLLHYVPSFGTVAVTLLFLFSCLALYYNFTRPNIVRQLTSVGFGYLAEEARLRGKSISEFAKETLQKRDPGAMPPVFPNGWIPILESRDLGSGQTKPVSALGWEFAVFRGENKKAYILDAFCPHLGAHLAVGGQVRGNCLECPFHGWSFRGDDGACVAVPYAAKVPDVARTKAWPSCETNGFIYVWYHAEGDPPSWTIPEIAYVNSGSWVYRGRTEHIVRCHVQDIPENGADVFHLHQVHSAAVLSGTDLRCAGSGIWNFMKHEWTPSWETEAHPNEHIANLTLQQQVVLFGYKVPLLDINLNIKQIGPAAVQLHFRCLFGRGVWLQHVVPEGPLQQRIVQQMYTTPFFIQLFATFILNAEATMIERDIMIWNNKQFLKNPVLLKEDKLIKRYRRWYSQFYSENSPKLNDLRSKCYDW